MKETIFIFLVRIPPLVLISYTLGLMVWNWWYCKHYRTKESTKEYGIDWHMCWDCKKPDSTMFYEHTFFGTIYRCDVCSINKNRDCEH
jgi:hypothetical protein